MLTWKIKTVVAILAVGTLMQTIPQDADAFIFRWLRERRAARVAYYSGYGQQAACCAPTVAAYTPSPCNTCNSCPSPCATPCTTTQRVCQRVPQTCYRTVYRQVPVTTYRPVTTADPCTGCRRTVMQPCTTVTQVAQRVPVTTYRQVCQMVQTPVAAAAPVIQQQQFAAPVQQYQPAQQYAPAQQHTPGCTSCGSAPAAPAAIPYAAAPAPTPAGPTTSLAPQAGQGGQPADNIPALPRQQQNFQVAPPAANNSSVYQGSSSRTSLPVPTTDPAPYQPRVQNLDIRPLPDLDRAPALLNPDDRAASLPQVAPGTIIPISWQTPVEEPTRVPKVYAAPAAQTQPKTRRLDDGGWRAARSY